MLIFFNFVFCKMEYLASRLKIKWFKMLNSTLIEKNVNFTHTK